jgi:hypothetical protein
MNDHHLNDITKLKKTQRQNIVPIILSNMFGEFWEFSFVPTYAHMVNIGKKRLSMYLDTYTIKKG